MPLALVVMIVIGCLGSTTGYTQDPRPPVFLEHADSVLGAGTEESGIRRYEGNVRFRQGNVTIQCDRAIEYVGTNSVDLMGRVVVRQGAMELRAPVVTYDGNAAIANARGGVFVRDGNRTIRAQTGSYSPELRVARFARDVHAQDDSLIVGSDSLTFYRTSRVLEAWGRVVMSTADSTTWITGDSASHDPSVNRFVVLGNARLWSREKPRSDSLSIRPDTIGLASAPPDTLYMEADTLHLSYQTFVRRLARGNAHFRRGADASRSGALFQDDSTEVVVLTGSPILWSDSSQITGDTLVIHAPGQRIRSIVAHGSAFMVSTSGPADDSTMGRAPADGSVTPQSEDASAQDRYDQISGSTIRIDIDQDTIRSVESVGDAKSLYFRYEGTEPQGLAQFASDTIRIAFEGGVPEDIRWLGTVRGEQHPENIVAGQVQVYRLPGFNWRTDCPVSSKSPASHGGQWRLVEVQTDLRKP